MSFLSKDVGIDLGTANTLVYMKGKGIIMREPSVVAVDTKTDEVRCVGTEAKAVIGRTPGSIVAVRPLKDGVIADFDITANLLENFLKKACGNSMFSRPRVVICIPSGVTEVERRAVREATLKAGAHAHGLGSAVVDIAHAHVRQIHHHETARATETGIDEIVKGGAFTGNGNLLHGILLCVRSPLIRFGQGIMTALDAQGPARDQGQRHRAPGRSQSTAERMPGHTHAAGGLGTGQTFQIRQTQGFEFFHAQADFLQGRHGDAPRLEVGDTGSGGHIAALSGTRHDFSNIWQNGRAARKGGRLADVLHN